MLTLESAALLAVMSFALLFVFSALGSARPALITRTENLARTIGYASLANARRTQKDQGAMQIKNSIARNHMTRQIAPVGLHPLR